MIADCAANPMKKPVLEVIACTVADAIAAERGGADRLEVVRRLDLGGLTPDADLVREILSNVKIPVRVMIRESANFTVADDAEFERLCEAAREFEKLGVNGIVLGFAKDGEPDIELTGKILECAPALNATFHHAFEETGDRFDAIKKLKTLPQIDRILSHGGRAAASVRCGTLDRYARAASPEMKLLAGGGIDAEMIGLLLETTSVDEFHIGSAARIDGDVIEYEVAEIRAALDASVR